MLSRVPRPLSAAPRASPVLCHRHPRGVTASGPRRRRLEDREGGLTSREASRLSWSFVPHRTGSGVKTRGDARLIRPSVHPSRGSPTGVSPRGRARAPAPVTRCLAVPRRPLLAPFRPSSGFRRLSPPVRPSSCVVRFGDRARNRSALDPGTLLNHPPGNASSFSRKNQRANDFHIPPRLVPGLQTDFHGDEKSCPPVLDTPETPFRRGHRAAARSGSHESLAGPHGDSRKPTLRWLETADRGQETCLS